ncbi:hypothetical protein NIES3275_46950 [Microchaete diplosiphon NIES-3275]|nr:hypothetical protein NIES3275_46950 [Microchaete diplosiphon NIES-3275]
MSTPQEKNILAVSMRYETKKILATHELLVGTHKFTPLPMMLYSIFKTLYFNKSKSVTAPTLLEETNLAYLAKVPFV